MSEFFDPEIFGSERVPAPSEIPSTPRSFPSMPVLLAGSVALSMTIPIVVTPPAQAAPSRPTGSMAQVPLHLATTKLSAPAQTAPARYEVKAGDSVSSIATRFGLSTAKVLALNGLSWRSLIFPGQIVTLRSHSAPGATSTGGGKTPVGTQLAESTDTSGVTCDSVKYTIMPGDTVGGIARRFGVSVESILKANKLSASSMIYAGRTLIIPNPQKLVDDCVVYARLTPAMRHNARIIIDVGRSAGIGDYGLVIALAAAAQESGLRNIDYGDRDSLGLFQQRPSAGWGTPDEILDQRHASSAFFGGAINPNPGRTRGLLDIDGWRNMSVTKAAQAVQLSARPRAYAKWEASARHWLSKLG